MVPIRSSPSLAVCLLGFPRNPRNFWRVALPAASHLTKARACDGEPRRAAAIGLTAGAKEKPQAGLKPGAAIAKLENSKAGAAVQPGPPVT